RLTEADKEKLQVKRNLRMIEALWNPTMPETSESLEDKRAVLSAILSIGYEARINHQEIADWIFGKGAVDVERDLEDLWLDRSGFLSEDIDPGFSVPSSGGQNMDPGFTKKIKEPGWLATQLEAQKADYHPDNEIEMWVTPTHSISVSYTNSNIILLSDPPKIPKPTIEITTNRNFGNVYKDPHLNRDYDFPIRKMSVANFAEANKELRNYIEWLRGKDKYEVTGLTEGGHHRPGSGDGARSGRGPLDVNPGSVEGGGEGPRREIEFDYTELIEKLAKSTDMKWILGQWRIAEQRIGGEVGKRIFEAILGNKYVNSNQVNLYKFFEVIRKKGSEEYLNAIIEKAPNTREFLKYLAWNLSKWINAEIRNEAQSLSFIRDYVLGADSKYLKNLVAWIKYYKKSHPDRYTWLNI
ncbi:MAG: hypothetical protein O3B47_00795, partial [bacterium]|nr:hypothetical protein [bacterium]